MQPATARFDPLLLLALALAAGAPIALAPLPACVALAACTTLLWRRTSSWLLMVALGLAALQSGRAWLALHDAGERARATAEALRPRARCELDARVVRSPIVLRAGREADAAAGRADVEVLRGACDERALAPGTVVRLYGLPHDLRRGDSLWLLADLGAVRAFDNPGLSDPRTRVALSGVTGSGSVAHLELRERANTPAALVDAARAFVRERIEASYAPAIAPYARALVLGETDMADEDRAAFRRSGLAHLLAVSGTHLVLVVLTVARILASVLVRVRPLAESIEVGRLTAAACIPLAWLYADFAGGGGSALRAAAMLSFALLARAAARRPCALRCFSASLALGALAEPLALCDLSFALSVAATAGLLLAQKPVLRLIQTEPRPLRIIAAAMLATSSATALCAPVLLGMEPDLPLLGVAANVLAAPPGELAALPLCLAHTLLWWAPAVESGAALVAGGALELVRAVAYASATSPLSVLVLAPPTSAQLALLVAAGAAGWIWRHRIVRVTLGTLALLAVLEVAAVRAGAPEGELRITVLDVGQGDALLVDLPDGSLMLIDGGGLVGSPVDTGERVVLPVLRARRRRRIDVAVLSHPHPDHYLGWMSVLERMEVGEIWDSGLAEAGRPEGELARFFGRMRARGVRIATSRDLCRAPRRFGDAVARVLEPCPTFDDSHGANDNSLVVHIAFGARAALLTGDAEVAEERTLIERHGDALVADFLKVGHHGSRTSTAPALLARVRPSHAAISCGVRNRFGHPHAPPLRALEDAGVDVLRTDRLGAIVWRTDGERIEVQAMAP